jgi:hypothetical protein
VQIEFVLKDPAPAAQVTQDVWTDPIPTPGQTVIDLKQRLD